MCYMYGNVCTPCNCIYDKVAFSANRFGQKTALKQTQVLFQQRTFSININKLNYFKGEYLTVSYTGNLYFVKPLFLFDWFVRTSSAQTFQTISLIYKRGNFVYHHW